MARRRYLSRVARRLPGATVLARARAGGGAAKRVAAPHGRVVSSLGDVREVVLILAPDQLPTATRFAEAFPESRVHVLTTSKGDASPLPANIVRTHCPAISDRTHYLARVPRPQILLESGNNRKGQKLACFRELFPFLESGGVYILENLSAVHDETLNDYQGEHVLQLLTRLSDLRTPLEAGSVDDEQPGDCELAASIEQLTFEDDAAYVTKRFDHLVKVRDSAANELLRSRYGARWGEVIETLPCETWSPRARAHQHGEGPQHDRASITVPERHLRRYDGPLCQPRQRVTYGNHYLPDTFRHPWQAKLNHEELIDASAWLARDRSPVSAAPRTLEGSYFYFDTEYPGHFGHVLTEVVGRYWGWQRAVELDPEVRPLVSLDPGQTLPEFQRLIFDAIGVPADRIEYVPAGTCAWVERLYAATPGLAQPHYVDPALGEVWARIADRLALPSETPSRIFVSRRVADTRSCTNTAQVEEFFAQQGFEVFYPEDRSFPEQVTMFRQASVVAGFGGSGMFSTMFAPGVPKLVLSGDSYTANNEFLIAAVVGGDVHYVWGDSEVKHPRGGWTWDAFFSNFRIDVGTELHGVVDEVLGGQSPITA